jgi:hypothetical protein
VPAKLQRGTPRDTIASTLTHAIVTICTRWIRRIASEEAVCSTEAIHDIIGTALAWFAFNDHLHFTLGVSFTVFRGKP